MQHLHFKKIKLWIKSNTIVLIFASSLFSMNTVNAANKCINLFQSGYGSLSQIDPYFFQNNLAKNDNQTMLCGPVCVYNVLEKIRFDSNENYSIQTNPHEVELMIKQVNTELGLSTEQIVRGGVRTGVLAHLLKSYFKKEKLNYSMSIKRSMSEPQNTIKLDDFVYPNNKDTAIILIGAYIGKYRTGGHFLIVTGANQKNKTLTLSDPTYPENVKAVLVEEFDLQGQTNKTLRLVDPLLPKGTFVIEDVLKIRNSRSFMQNILDRFGF